MFKRKFKLNITREMWHSINNWKIVTLQQVFKDSMYINLNSNHPPNIIKNLPGSISRRISKLSADETIFNLYNHALSKKGFKDKNNFQLKDDIQNPRKNKTIRGKKYHMAKTAI